MLGPWPSTSSSASRKVTFHRPVFGPDVSSTFQFQRKVVGSERNLRQGSHFEAKRNLLEKTEPKEGGGSQVFQMTAGGFIPKNTTSSAFHFDLSDFEDFLKNFDSECEDRSIVVEKHGRLDVKKHGKLTYLISKLSPAHNIHAQNCSIEVESIKCSRNVQVRIRTMKNIEQDEQLQFWPSDELCRMASFPVLGLINIKGGSSYACHLCFKSFTEPNPLKAHLYLKECQQMNKTSSPAITAEPSVHMKSVIESPDPRKGHLCMYCGKMYSRKYGLKIHIRTHTGYKPLQCKFCSRAFGDPSNLNKHIRLHLDDHAKNDSGVSATPYRCRICNKVLVRKRDLDRHVKSRHPHF